ncbi:hypothetical protein N7463_000434 [Penicillium fimorum]|uniref:Uncharacterized protein n=1 Tax=Penicillium fimorum TaxID=1882269 RepID=A0A9W9Y4G3_9EURO|nr:hypothetical protein N7463_000434 [Penicillium fimorum]
MIGRLKDKFRGKSRKRIPKKDQSVESKLQGSPSTSPASPALVLSENSNEVAPSLKKLAPVPHLEDLDLPLQPSEESAPTEDIPERENFPPKDLWQDASKQLPNAKQETLRKMGYDKVNTGSMESSVDDLVTVVQKKLEAAQANFSDEDKAWILRFMGYSSRAKWFIKEQETQKSDIVKLLQRNK